MNIISILCGVVCFITIPWNIYFRKTLKRAGREKSAMVAVGLALTGFVFGLIFFIGGYFNW